MRLARLALSVLPAHKPELPAPPAPLAGRELIWIDLLKLGLAVTVGERAGDTTRAPASAHTAICPAELMQAAELWAHRPGQVDLDEVELDELERGVAAVDGLRDDEHECHH